MNLRKLFIIYCEKNKFEINQSQLSIIDNLIDFYLSNFKNLNILNFLKKIIKKLDFI